MLIKGSSSVCNITSSIFHSEIGQFCGNRSLIKNRRMRQATTIIVFNFIIRDIPC